MKRLIFSLGLMAFLIAACGGGGGGSSSGSSDTGSGDIIVDNGGNAMVIDFRSTTADSEPTDGALLTLPDGTVLSFTALGAQVYVNGEAKFRLLPQRIGSYYIFTVRAATIEIWDYSVVPRSGVLTIDWRSFGAPRLWALTGGREKRYDFFGPPGEGPMATERDLFPPFTTPGEKMDGEITYISLNVISFDLSANF